MKFRFFKAPKPTQFHINYRYYDPKKEEREKRERRIKAELGQLDENEAHDYHSSIKGSFRSGGISGASSFAHKQRRTSNLRLAVILAILIAILYYFFLN